MTDDAADAIYQERKDEKYLEELARPLTQGEMHLYEWQFGTAGGFMLDLFRLLGHSDSTNLTKLSLGYPSEVAAFRRYRSEPEYWAKIQKKWNS
jgi:hypothetical protein